MSTSFEYSALGINALNQLNALTVDTTYSSNEAWMTTFSFVVVVTSSISGLKYKKDV